MIVSHTHDLALTDIVIMTDNDPSDWQVAVPVLWFHGPADVEMRVTDAEWGQVSQSQSRGGGGEEKKSKIYKNF